MKLLSLLVVLMFSLVSEARLEGSWKGYGSWKFKGEGDGVPCNMSMRWTETAETITIVKSDFICDLVSMHGEKVSWTIKENNLVDEEGNIVGSYDGENFSVTMPSGYDNTDISIRLKRTGNNMDYQEVWFDARQTVYVIEARFATKGN